MTAPEHELELDTKVQVISARSVLFAGLIGTIDCHDLTRERPYRVWFDPPGIASAWFRAEELEPLAT